MDLLDDRQADFVEIVLQKNDDCLSMAGQKVKCLMPSQHQPTRKIRGKLA